MKYTAIINVIQPRLLPLLALPMANPVVTCLPGDEDQKFIQSLMHRVTEPGKMAGSIAPPDCGINAQVVEYEYVKL
jgi:benzoyl-CoA 2,3-epoxidase subunit B